MLKWLLVIGFGSLSFQNAQAQWITAYVGFLDEVKMEDQVLALRVRSGAAREIEAKAKGPEILCRGREGRDDRECFLAIGKSGLLRRAEDVQKAFDVEGAKIERVDGWIASVDGVFRGKLWAESPHEYKASPVMWSYFRGKIGTRIYDLVGEDSQKNLRCRMRRFRSVKTGFPGPKQKTCDFVIAEDFAERPDQPAKL